MQKNSRSFLSDTRNVGGRQHVIETMLSHQAKLRAIVSEPRGGKALKVSGFSGPPATYLLAKKLSQQRARKQGRKLNEQEKADQNMLRRMQTYPLPAQRKQNPQDFVAHPVKLFRNDGEPHSRPDSARGGGGAGLMGLGSSSPRRLYQSSPRSASLRPAGSPSPSAHRTPRGGVLPVNHFASAQPRGAGGVLPGGMYKRPALEVMEYAAGMPVSRRAHPMDSDHVEPGSEGRAFRPASARVRSANQSAPRGSRPASAHPSSSSSASTAFPPSYQSYAADVSSTRESLASADALGDPYAQLKNKLLALIVQHRIFREKAILKLLDKARQINTHLNQAKVERVLEELKLEFEINPNARLDDPVPARRTALDRDLDALEARSASLRGVRHDLAEEAAQGRLAAAEREREAEDEDRSAYSRRSSRSSRSRASRSRSHSPHSEDEHSHRSRGTEASY